MGVYMKAILTQVVWIFFLLDQVQADDETVIRPNEQFRSRIYSDLSMAHTLSHHDLGVVIALGSVASTVDADARAAKGGNAVALGARVNQILNAYDQVVQQSNSSNNIVIGSNTSKDLGDLTRVAEIVATANLDPRIKVAVGVGRVALDTFSRKMNEMIAPAVQAVDRMSLNQMRDEVSVNEDVFANYFRLRIEYPELAKVLDPILKVRTGVDPNGSVPALLSDHMGYAAHLELEDLQRELKENKKHGSDETIKKITAEALKKVETQMADLDQALKDKHSQEMDEKRRREELKELESQVDQYQASFAILGDILQFSGNPKTREFGQKMVQFGNITSNFMKAALKPDLSKLVKFANFTNAAVALFSLLFTQHDPVLEQIKALQTQVKEMGLALSSQLNAIQKDMHELFDVTFNLLELVMKQNQNTQLLLLDLRKNLEEIMAQIKVDSEKMDADFQSVSRENHPSLCLTLAPEKHSLSKDQFDKCMDDFQISAVITSRGTPLTGLPTNYWSVLKYDSAEFLNRFPQLQEAQYFKILNRASYSPILNQINLFNVLYLQNGMIPDRMDPESTNSADQYLKNESSDLYAKFEIPPFANPEAWEETLSQFFSFRKKYSQFENRISPERIKLLLKPAEDFQSLVRQLRTPEYRKAILNRLKEKHDSFFNQLSEWEAMYRTKELKILPEMKIWKAPSDWSKYTIPPQTTAQSEVAGWPSLELPKNSISKTLNEFRLAKMLHQLTRQNSPSDGELKITYRFRTDKQDDKGTIWNKFERVKKGEHKLSGRPAFQEFGDNMASIKVIVYARLAGIEVARCEFDSRSLKIGKYVKILRPSDPKRTYLVDERGNPKDFFPSVWAEAPQAMKNHYKCIPVGKQEALDYFALLWAKKRNELREGFLTAITSTNTTTVGHGDLSGAILAANEYRGVLSALRWAIVLAYGNQIKRSKDLEDAFVSSKQRLRYLDLMNVARKEEKQKQLSYSEAFVSHAFVFGLEDIDRLMEEETLVDGDPVIERVKRFFDDKLQTLDTLLERETTQLNSQETVPAIDLLTYHLRSLIAADLSDNHR
jgi:hypothetical protein